MTKERAISEVMQIYGYLSPDKQQALDVLMQATKDLDKLQNVLDAIRAEIEINKKGFPPSSDYYKAITRAVNIIDEYRKGGE